MKNGDSTIVALELAVRHKKGSTGLMVGFFREFPLIAGQDKTFDDLVTQLQYDLGIYFMAFPEKNEILVK
jgi:hypothetical protein